MEEKQEIIAGPIYGYKATDIDMKCRGFQFELGKRIKLENNDELKECQNGFHFCIYPSGVYSFYDYDCRVFKVRAFDVLKTTDTPGASCKKVCREIEFIEEITPKEKSHRNTGYGNTGHSNTGHRNTGHRNTGDNNTGDNNTGHNNTGDNNTGDNNTGHNNTGDRNTGDNNTGHSNTGRWNTSHSNTGDNNTGHSNTGRWNTGDNNTGHNNTGHRNTGHRNTGHRNTGYNNTGDNNTGYGNCCDRSTGHFNSKRPKIRMFDKIVNDESKINLDLVYYLSGKLCKDEDFDVSVFLTLPNATEKKIKDLHKKHIEARKKSNTKEEV